MKEPGAPAIRREYGLLGCAFVLLALSTVAWRLLDRTPPAWDPADHIRTAYDFYWPLSQGHFAEFFRGFFHEPHPYAPLFHLITAGFFLIAGASQRTGIAANFLALAVMLVSVHSIGRRLHPAPAESESCLRPATVAALLAVCYPFPAWLIHDAFLDYFLIAMVALAFALLLRADEFHVRTDAVLFGIAAGLGMLTKQTFAFFFILPAAFLCARAVKRRDWQATANLLLSASIAALIASIWYIPHFGDIMGIYRVNAEYVVAEHKPPVRSLYSFAYYTSVLGDVQTQLIFAGLFVAGAAYSIRRRIRQDWMLYLWVLSGIGAFTLIANKNIRYTAPILPAVALLSVSWLDRLKPKLRTLAATAMVLWAGISFLNSQWPSERREIRVDVMGKPLYFLAGNTYGFDHQPLDDDWSIPEIVRASKGRLGVVPNIWQFNPSNIALYATLHEIPLHVDWLVDDGSLGRLGQCDYVLVRTHLETAQNVAPIEKVIAVHLSEHSSRFIPVATFGLPNRQEAVLYKRQ